MKYQAGDSVVIRKDLEDDQFYGEYHTVDSMMDYLGKTVKIEWVGDDFYYIDCDYRDHFWTDEMIDHEATFKMKEK